MNEVEKMYENAEPNRDCNLYKHFTECPMKHTQCEDCENFVYPPFTAEKQLELIKWLARKSHITIGLGLPWGQYDDSWWTVTSKNGGLGTNAYKFEEALASFVNSKWQDLTEEERKQIKEILE